MPAFRSIASILPLLVLATKAQNAVNLTFSTDNSCYENTDGASSNISISIGGYPRYALGVCFNLNDTFVQPSERADYHDQFRCRYASLNYEPSNSSTGVSYGTDGCIGSWGNNTLEVNPSSALATNYTVTSWENFDPQANYSQVTISQFGDSGFPGMFIIEASATRDCGYDPLRAARYDCGTDTRDDDEQGWSQGEFCGVLNEEQTRRNGVQSFRLLESPNWRWRWAYGEGSCVMGVSQDTLANAGVRSGVSFGAMLLLMASALLLV